MPICDRCHQETYATIMSMFNTQTICMPCKNEERTKPEYNAAHEADIAQIKQGNYNYEGVGLPCRS